MSYYLLNKTADLFNKETSFKRWLVEHTISLFIDALVDLGFSDTSVSRYGNCYGYSYIIETDNTAGDHDEFTVSCDVAS